MHVIKDILANIGSIVQTLISFRVRAEWRKTYGEDMQIDWIYVSAYLLPVQDLIWWLKQDDIPAHFIAADEFDDGVTDYTLMVPAHLVDHALDSLYEMDGVEPWTVD